MTADQWKHDDTKRWIKHVRRSLLPKLRDSAMTLAVAPEEPDIKMAVEVGLSLLLGKPLILIVVPGRPVPDGLARAADAIVEWSDDPVALQARLRDAVQSVAPEVLS